MDTRDVNLSEAMEQVRVLDFGSFELLALAIQTVTLQMRMLLEFCRMLVLMLSWLSLVQIILKRLKLCDCDNIVGCGLEALCDCTELELLALCVVDDTSGRQIKIPEAVVIIPILERLAEKDDAPI